METEQREQQQPSTELQTLEEHIALLSELSTRVETLRQTPAYLRPPIGTQVVAATQAALIKQGFEHIKQFSEKVQAESVQEVLRKARESESKDKADLHFTHRRKHLKRQWVFVLA